MNRRHFLGYAAGISALLLYPRLGKANPPPLGDPPLGDPLPGMWPLDLDGEMIQGGLIFGKTFPSTRLKLEDQEIPVYGDGRFLLGFSRDQKPKANLYYQVDEDHTFVAELMIKQRTYDIQHVNGLPQATVTPDPEAEKRIIADREKVKAARKMLIDKPYYQSGFIWPALGVISGVYGSQRILNGTPRQPHYGVDVAVAEGTPIKAPADGVIGLAEPDLFLTGGTVILNHGEGLCSDFLHMSRLDVHIGDIVKQGQIIGAVGKTGRATGPHLHWGMTLGEIRLDPQLIVPPMKL